jgi:cell shape-determining protein MreC
MYNIKIILPPSSLELHLSSFKFCSLLFCVKTDQVNFVMTFSMHTGILFSQNVVEELRERISKKKAQIASMMEKTSEVRRMKDELQQTLSLVSSNFNIYSFHKNQMTIVSMKLY